MKLFFMLCVFAMAPTALCAGNLHPERWYQSDWCASHHGKTEVVLPDRTRCDCLTDTHAIEFDFGEKWAEAIGQALYYGIQTGRTPGVVLILEQEKDNRYWIRLNTVLEQYGLPVTTWKITPGISPPD
jgi:hypothetical protein